MMENLGVMYLSSVIKKAGHECKIWDMEYASSFKNIGAYRCYDPDIVGFSIMTGDMNKFKGLKLWLTQSRVATMKIPRFIVGGPDVSFFPEGYDWADEVCKGEGEQWMVDLLLNKNNYEDIDSIPWPDRTDFPNMRIRDFISSRGCPYSCNYCFNAQWKELFPQWKHVRTRSAKDVVAEIKSVNPEYVFFQDSCFGVNINWMGEFADRYANDIKRPYQCNFRPEQINEQRVVMLQKSGCVAVRMALESASNRLRSLINRNTVTLKTVREASEILQAYEIQFMLQNILGLPTSSIEDDLFTLEMNIKYKPTYAWASIFQPYPGTRLGNMCKEHGWYKGDYFDIGDNFFDTSILHFDRKHKEQLEVLQKIFALCVDYEYLPKVGELTHKNLPKLVHTVTRKAGDRKLYLNIL
jgi:radical SAM superfamily enzyme YgiQ (UPF0313 family)